MARWWKGIALCMGWLGATALAEAQNLPANPAPALGAGMVPFAAPAPWNLPDWEVTLLHLYKSS